MGRRNGARFTVRKNKGSESERCTALVNGSKESVVTCDRRLDRKGKCDNEKKHI